MSLVRQRETHKDRDRNGDRNKARESGTGACQMNGGGGGGRQRLADRGERQVLSSILSGTHTTRYECVVRSFCFLELRTLRFT